MKIDFSAILLDLNGAAVNKSASADDGPATLAFVSCEALLAPEQSQSSEDKVRQFALAIRIVNGGEQEVTPEEATLIKACVGRVYPPLIVGRAYELLNG